MKPRTAHAGSPVESERFQHLSELLHEVVFQLDAQGRLTVLSGAWERLTGTPVADWQGARCWRPSTRRTASARRRCWPTRLERTRRVKRCAWTRAAAGVSAGWRCPPAPWPRCRAR
ncbi:PAS domain-containing protein [Myxococcus sp. 1LA]